MGSTTASRGKEGVVSKALYSIGALATALETATPDFLRRRFGLRVLLAGPLCSVIGFPFAAAYLIENAHLSFVVAGGGVAVTGFMVYAEMYWLLRKMNEKVIEIEGGAHDISFDYERLDSIGVIFETFEGVAREGPGRFNRRGECRPEASRKRGRAGPGGRAEGSRAERASSGRRRHDAEGDRPPS